MLSFRSTSRNFVWKIFTFWCQNLFGKKVTDQLLNEHKKEYMAMSLISKKILLWWHFQEISAVSSTYRKEFVKIVSFLWNKNFLKKRI